MLDFFYFEENQKMSAIDLIKQQVLDAHPRAVQQINFTANLDRAGNVTMLFIIEEAKETILDFSQERIKLLWIKFHWVQMFWVQFYWIQFY